MNSLARAIRALARAIGRAADHGPVSHLCCVEGKDGPRLIAVIYGRIFWRPLTADWLANKWVPLAMPDEEPPGVSVSNPTVDT